MIGIEEKPERPKSSYAAPVVVDFYDGEGERGGRLRRVQRARGVGDHERQQLLPGPRRALRRADGARDGLAGTRGYALEGLLKAAEYVEAVQSRQGYYIACIEEIAYRRGFIGAAGLLGALGEAMGKTAYGKYLLSVAAEEES